MSNNKSSVTELYNKMMQYVPIEYHELVREEIPLGQYEAMHKEEMIMFVLNVMGSYRHGDVLAEVATELYEQTFGGNNEQQ